MPTVMIVDDEAISRETLGRLLRREGYQTVMAPGGNAALDLLEQSLPDVILLDVNMPGLDGLSVLEMLHHQPKWRSVPVIMLTAVSDTHAIHRAEQLGAKQYLVKAAFSLQEMMSHIKFYTRQTVPEGK